jgi:hypothetical protein
MCSSLFDLFDHFRELVAVRLVCSSGRETFTFVVGTSDHMAAGDRQNHHILADMVAFGGDMAACTESATFIPRAMYIRAAAVRPSIPIDAACWADYNLPAVLPHFAQRRAMPHPGGTALMRLALTWTASWMS